MQSVDVTAIRKLFVTVDKDNSGRLDREEIAGVMTQLRNGKRPREEQIDECFRDMDSDGNGVIDENEFVSALLKVCKRQEGNTLHNFTDYFLSFSGDLFKDQSTVSFRSKSDLNSESLCFGLVTYPSDFRESFMKSTVEAMLNPSFPEFVSTMRTDICSENGPRILTALGNMHQLLRISEVFPATRDRQSFIHIFNAIFSIVTTPVEGRSIIDKIVNFIDLSDPKLVQIQQLALDCLFLYILGPRCPVEGIWHPDQHLTQRVTAVACDSSFLNRCINVFQANSIVVESNQSLLAKLVNCVSAYVDGNSSHLKVFVDNKFRGLLLHYLKQPLVRLSPELLRALSFASSIFCGHNSNVVEVEDLAAEDAAACAISAEELGEILSVNFAVLSSCLSAGAPVVDECSLIHLITVYGLILPRIDDAMLISSCSPIIEQLLSVLSRTWVQIEAWKLAIFRINHCFVDLIKRDRRNVAEWLLSFPNFVNCLKSQLELGLNDKFGSVSISAIKVIEEYIYLHLGDEIVRNYYTSFICLLNNPIVRPWITNSILLPLIEPQPYVVAMLEKGLVDALMRDLHRLRLRPLLADSSTHGCMVHVAFNTDLTALIVKKLIQITKFSKTELKSFSSDEKLVSFLASVFSYDHIDSIKDLHRVICAEISTGNISEDDAVCKSLLDDCVELLRLIGNIHLRADTDISGALCVTINELMADWNTKILENIEKARALSQSSASDETVMDMATEGSLIARKLPYLKNEIGGDEIELLVKPMWHFIDTDGTEYSEPDKLYLIPKSVSIEDLHKCLGMIYGRLIKLGKQNATKEFEAVSSQASLAKMVEQAETEKKRDSKSIRITLFLLVAQEGELTVHTMAAALAPKDAAMRAVNQTAAATGIKVNKGLIDKLYEFFSSKRVNEINIDQFVECMKAVFQVNEDASRPLFRSLDKDASGLLSLSELAIGLAMMVEGTEEEKIIAAFNAYDADHSGTLEYDEVVSLVTVAKKTCSRHEAEMLTAAAFRHVGVDPSSTLSLEQFLRLVKDRHLSLDSLLPDVKETYQQLGNRWGPKGPAFVPFAFKKGVFSPDGVPSAERRLSSSQSPPARPRNPRPPYQHNAPPSQQHYKPAWRGAGHVSSRGGDWRSNLAGRGNGAGRRDEY